MFKRCAAAAVAAVFVVTLASCGPAWKRPVYKYMDTAGKIVGILYTVGALSAQEANQAFALLAKAEAAVKKTPETYAEVKTMVKHEIGAALLLLLDSGRIEAYQYEFLTNVLDRW